MVQATGQQNGRQHVPDLGNARRCREKAMILANILLHLDSTPRTAARVALSLHIAERTGARLTGLFAEKADAYVVGTVATWPSAHYRAAVEGARSAFAAATAPLKDRAAFIDLNRGSDHEIIHRAIAVARSFDLIVLGQTQDGVPVPAKLPDEIITESGRPVLVVPYRAARRAPPPTSCRCSSAGATH
jgi:hypothetical protein